MSKGDMTMPETSTLIKVRLSDGRYISIGLDKLSALNKKEKLGLPNNRKDYEKLFREIESAIRKNN